MVAGNRDILIIPTPVPSSPQYIDTQVKTVGENLSQVILSTVEKRQLFLPDFLALPGNHQAETLEVIPEVYVTVSDML